MTASAIVSLAALEVPPQELRVPKICAEGDVEEVADQRHRAAECVDRDIADHPRDQPARRAEAARFENDEARDACRDQVADAWKEANQRIRAEPDIRARHDDGGVHDGGERFQPREAFFAAYIARIAETSGCLAFS